MASTVPRRALQALCKQHGLKANGKNDELITLLNKAGVQIVDHAVGDQENAMEPAVSVTPTESGPVLDSDVGKWLDENGFGDYRAAFQKEGVDMAALPLLSETSLHIMGVRLGDALKMLKARDTFIASLSQDQSSMQVESTEPAPAVLAPAITAEASNVASQSAPLVTPLAEPTPLESKPELNSTDETAEAPKRTTPEKRKREDSMEDSDVRNWLAKKRLKMDTPLEIQTQYSPKRPQTPRGKWSDSPKLDSKWVPTLNMNAPGTPQ